MKQINPNASQPRLAKYEFYTDLGKGNSIFIGSSTDMFADNIPSEWITQVLNYCQQKQDTKRPNWYLLQSKNPKRFLEFANHPLMKQVVFATTIESNRNYPEIMSNSPKIEERAEAMEKIANLGFRTMVTAEPLMQFDLTDMVSIIKQCQPRLVNIGRNTCRDIQLPEPEPEEVRGLVTSLSDFTRVNIKKNAMIWFK
jgi:DNA repair photolyase